MTFPVDRVNYRSFASDWAGEVFVCDIDRTYLATRFSTLKGLLRIPFESAVDKVAIAGMAPLLKEVRRGPAAQSRHTPLYFVSASPAELRPVIERKMLLDGLEYDGTTFKSWSGVARGLRPSRLREQLGYKLTALLQARLELPLGAHEVLLGDDTECDALAAAIYADLLSGRLASAQAPGLLVRQGVLAADAEAIAELSAQVGQGRGVAAAFIRLELRQPRDLIEYAPWVQPVRGALQMAAALFGRGSIGLRGLVRVAAELLLRGVGRAELAALLVDALRRGVLPLTLGATVQDALLAEGLLVAAQALPGRVDPEWARVLARDPAEPWRPARYR
ncbi:MAG: hypothetical protein IPL40_03440 [Proteobacteria bacterium]|nr:hypothetical protein [Pseudomonadota bacterium]